MVKRWLAVMLALLLCAGCGNAPAPQAAAASSTVSESPPLSIPSSQTVESQPPTPPVIEYPLLVTALGQGTDGLLVREMLSDLKVDFTYETVVPPDKIGDYRTVLLAVGASTKALGSLGYTAEAELDRCRVLLEAISDESVVILVRLGDSASQDGLTGALIDLALPYADMVLVTQNSDREGVIAKFAAEHGVSCSISSSVRQMTEALSMLILETAPGQ